MSKKPPKTKKENIKEKIHGVEVEDPYRWLEEKDSKEVQEWLDEQDKYARKVLEDMPYRNDLSEEFKELFYKETPKFPIPRKGRYFFMKQPEGKELSILYVAENLEEDGEVLVDPNKLSEEKDKIINLSSYNASKSGKFVNYYLSEAANDQNTLKVMDVDRKETLEDEVPSELYPRLSSWSADDSGFWYTRRKQDVPEGEEKLHKKIYYHELGTDFEDDELIFGEDIDKSDIPVAHETDDGEHVVVTWTIMSEEDRHNNIYLLDPDDPDRQLTPVVEDIQNEEGDTLFRAKVHRGYVYIQTNYKADNWRILRVPVPEVEKGMDAWEEVIPESDRQVMSFSLIQDKLFVTFSENVNSSLYEYSLDGQQRREIELPTLGTCGPVRGESEGEEGFFGFTSYGFPSTIYRLDFKKGERSVVDRTEVDMDVSDIKTEQVWFESKDGTEVPMFLVYKGEVEKNGENPTLLSGYGGFGISRRPRFRKHILPFLRRGGVYAVANIRGGGEFGEEWYQAGTRKDKQNTFDDFISAAEWLDNNNYTSPEHLGVKGGSNGGLLVGAVMTQRPDLMNAVVMEVPVVDMMRYHKFEGGRLWKADYGTAEEPEMVEYLLSYSPYHNVEDGTEYPATLVITSDQDDRVHPSNAFKMTARLQEANGSDSPIVLRIERDAGHGGAADVTRKVEEQVDTWSFLLEYLE